MGQRRHPGKYYGGIWTLRWDTNWNVPLKVGRVATLQEHLHSCVHCSWLEKFKPVRSVTTWLHEACTHNKQSCMTLMTIARMHGHQSVASTAYQLLRSANDTATQTANHDNRHSHNCRENLIHDKLIFPVWTLRAA